MTCTLCSCSPCCCVTTVPCVPTCDPCCDTSCVPCPCPTDPCDAKQSIPLLWEEISSFVVPAVDSGVNVSVKQACRWLIGCCVIIKDDTQSVELQITSSDLENNTIFLVNNGVVGNPDPGAIFSDPSRILFKGQCSDATVEPEEEDSFRMLTDELFVVPDVGANSTLKLLGDIGLSVGQTLFIEGGVCVRVVSVTNNNGQTCVEVEGVSLPPSILPGSIIPTNSFVVPAESCVETDSTLSGSGSAADPLTVTDTGGHEGIVTSTEFDLSAIVPTGTAYSGEDLSNAYDGNDATFTGSFINNTVNDETFIWDLGSKKVGYIWFLIDFAKSTAESSSSITSRIAWDSAELDWLLGGDIDNGAGNLSVNSTTNLTKTFGQVQVRMSGQFVCISFAGTLRFRRIQAYLIDHPAG